MAIDGPSGCPISANRPQLDSLNWDEESSMTQDRRPAVPFAWFEGWLVSLNIAQMAVSRSMTLMLASAPNRASTTAATEPPATLRHIRSRIEETPVTQDAGRARFLDTEERSLRSDTRAGQRGGGDRRYCVSGLS